MRRVCVAMAALWVVLGSAAPVTANDYVTLSSVGPAFASSDTNATAFIYKSILTVGDQQFVTYYNNNQNVTVARRTLGTDAWAIYPTTFTAFNVYDGHDVISFGIDGAGYMHLSWGMHGNSLLYAISTTPVTGSGAIAFNGPIAMTGFENSVTYPQFYELPDGDLLFLFREGTSGAGDTYWDRYDVQTSSWSTVHGGSGQSPFFKGTGWSPDYNLYNNHAVLDSQGNLHLTGTLRYNGDSPTGASGFQTNHDIFYFRSPDFAQTWERMNGSSYTLPISEFGENGDRSTQAERVLTIPEGSSLINQCSMTVDENDLPVFAMWWAPEASSGNHARQYMLGWYDGSQWQTSQVTHHSTDYDPDNNGVNDPIPESQLFNYRMSRPAVLVDDEGRVILLYSDYHRGQVVTAAWSEDRVNWNFIDLTSESAGGWEPTIDQAMWRTAQKVNMLYLPTGVGSSTATAKVLEWDAVENILNPPQPATPNPGDVLLADTFETSVLGDPLTQSGVLAPAGYATLGNDVGTGDGALELNVFGDAGSAALSPIIDLGSAEIAAAGGYMVTLTGVDPVVGGAGTDTDWLAISLLRDSAGGSNPYVLGGPYGMLLRDTSEAVGFLSGNQFLQQVMDPAPPNAYDLRYVVEYQQDGGLGDARVSAYFALPELQTTIYSHDFSGSGAALNGTAVDVGGAVWQAGSAFRDDGAVETVVAGSANGQAAFLPFTPESGYVYTLSVEIENQYSDWIACGFLPALPPGGSWTATSYDVRHSNNGAYAWVLTRNASGSNQQGFNGPSTLNGAFDGNYAATSAPVEITIVLDTQASTWTAEYLLNSVSRGTYNLSSSAASSIGGVGFSRDRNASSGTGGQIDNFSLTVSPGVMMPGALELIDTTTLANVSLASQFFTLESRNEFSTIDALEVRALVPGDSNLDSVVDQADAEAVMNGLGAAGQRAEGEFTLDDYVDITDFSVVQCYYGFGTGG